MMDCRDIGRQDVRELLRFQMNWELETARIDSHLVLSTDVAARLRACKVRVELLQELLRKWREDHWLGQVDTAPTEDPLLYRCESCDCGIFPWETHGRAQDEGVEIILCPACANNGIACAPVAGSPFVTT